MRWVIVAHPDDELIFAGAAMLARRDKAWTVVIATHDEASPRAAESLRARDGLLQLGVNVRYRFLGHDDQMRHATGGIDADGFGRQLAGLGVKPGARVYTHGAPGEYGHFGHRAVHRIVLETLAGAAVVSVFSGGGKLLERIADPELLALKADLFRAAYPSQQGVWSSIAETMEAVMREEPHFAPPPSRPTPA